MTDYETLLIETIRNHKNPEQALSTAITIIQLYLTHPELFVGIQDCLNYIENHILFILRDSSK